MSQVMAPPAAPAAATDLNPALRSGLTSRHVRLTALPSAVSWARRELRHMLREWRLESMSDPALLLVSELVTNAGAPRGALLYPWCSREELKGGSWA